MLVLALYCVEDSCEQFGVDGCARGVQICPGAEVLQGLVELVRLEVG
jgi:hypothetical protein